MSKLLMISGDRSLAEGKRGAFYNTLEEFRLHWDRIDIVCPWVPKAYPNPFPNVFLHPSPWSLWFQSFWILKQGKLLFSKEKFDFVTAHDYPPFYNGIGARLLWQKIRVPYVLEIMHIPGLPRAANAKEKIYKKISKIFLGWDASKSKAVRVINKTQTPEFLKAAGIPDSKIRYIPAFYVDFDVFKPDQSIEKKYDLVFAARLEENKGILNLVKAVKILKHKHPKISLLVIGSGPLKGELQVFVREHRLEDNIHFSGWLETSNDVARAYQSARVFVNPSLNEGGPRVALEAMACGVPIITTHVGIMEDIIEDNKNGMFSGWEPHDLAANIEVLLNSPSLQSQFLTQALETVKQFERKESIKKYAQALQNL
ncbi:glycosyltransferase family 4 protein [Candidatus Parcubacteria bacterium]|nr:glycosyltransferase family 4 protein [Candidatus Parcubacteria bacterium]